MTAIHRPGPYAAGTVDDMRKRSDENVSGTAYLRQANGGRAMKRSLSCWKRKTMLADVELRDTRGKKQGESVQNVIGELHSVCRLKRRGTKNEPRLPA